MAPHPEELSRAISEIDLNSIQRRSDTLPEHGKGYSREQLLGLRPEDDEHVETTEVNSEGVKTPPEPPAVPPPTPEHSTNTPQETPLGEADGNAAVPAAEPVKKKKKKSSGKNKKPAPTGFEEFYADPPMTPNEHEEECDLYDPSRPFEHRIETCIQRYRGRRKLDEVRANIITKYFMLGGIESSSNKTFTGGLDKDTLENATAAEIAAIQATDFVRAEGKNAKYYDPSNPEGWVVDFEGVAKGFLSHSAPRYFDSDDEKNISTYCSVIKNFLNYVLTHEVCPEYTENILAARKTCDLGEKELIAIKHLRQLQPGDFNVAASTLYGGQYQGINIGSKWTTDDDFIVPVKGFDVSEAHRIFKTAIALSGTEEMFDEVMKEEVEITKTQTLCLQVVGVENASDELLAQYAMVKNSQGEAGYIKALGVLHVKYWEGPCLEPEDMTDDEDNEGSAIVDHPTESFWLEDDILKHCFMGMKFEAVVHELNIGLKFFDSIHSAVCSFYTVLPNDKMMMHWKEPVPNTRPPPTEGDPDAEENAMFADMEDDVKEGEKLEKKLLIN